MTQPSLQIKVISRKSSFVEVLSSYYKRAKESISFKLTSLKLYHENSGTFETQWFPLLVFPNPLIPIWIKQTNF